MPQGGAGERLTETPPAPLELDPFARREWAALAPLAIELGVLCKADLRAFQLLCEVLSSERELRDLLKKEGLTIPGADGNLKSHPAVSMLEKTRSQAHRLLADFGLTPKGRQSVDIAPPPRQSFFDKLDGRTGEQRERQAWSRL
jgi:P27 family predicted phage terminase small subunit